MHRSKRSFAEEHLDHRPPAAVRLPLRLFASGTKANSPAAFRRANGTRYPLTFHLPPTDVAGAGRALVPTRLFPMEPKQKAASGLAWGVNPDPFPGRLV